MRFPLANGAFWQPTEEQQVRWAAAYTDLDFGAELTRACIWLEANTARRKTARGMPKFLVGWLNRSRQDTRTRQALQIRRLLVRRPEPWVCDHTPRCPHRTACWVVRQRKRSA
jgi:hypothetical protein